MALRAMGVLVLCTISSHSCAFADRTPGQVLIRVDVAASLEVDGRLLEALSPGRPRTVALAQGNHRLAVVTSGGELRWEETVAVTPGQTVRLLALARMVQHIRQDFVRIPAGTFAMGCVESDTQCAADEKPRHEVNISRDFWMGRTEVTVRAYEAYAKAAGHEMPAAPRFNPNWKWKTYPIVNVSWPDAAAYCRRESGRLPTEAEWEYAARGGRTGWRYVWGSDTTPVVAGYKQANVADERVEGEIECQDGPCFDGYDDGYSGTSPAFQYSPNGFGLFDMAGNVWEWTAGGHGEDEEKGSGTSQTTLAQAGAARVLRGGSWRVGAAGLRASRRFSYARQQRRDDIGFRCARDVAVPAGSAVAAGLSPARTAGTSTTPRGRLVLRTDAAAMLVVDGQRAESLAPTVPRRFDLEPGEHLVTAVSDGGEAKWERVVHVGTAPVERMVELATAVEGVRRAYQRIPAGTFAMGCVEGDEQCEQAENPRHEVTLTRDFWMMRAEVTVSAYQAFAAATGRAMPPASDTNEGWGLATHPMVNLTWEDAAAYCAAIGGRLPTEAEWEYAARGGRSGWRYVWGNEARPVVDGRRQANVGDERAKGKVGCPQCGWFDGYDDGHVYTAPVGSFAPNGFGLFDMAGNVIEWCADWYRERYYDHSPIRDPPGSEFGRWRVLRGGSWSMNPKGLRISYRGGFPPDRTTDNYGVRCARDVAVP